MTRLRVLVVDDERLARQKLRRLLGGEPDVEVVGECANGLEAAASIRELRPDLVFLDVQMPGADGFDVLHEVGRERMPAVVFVTAHDRYAVRAFEVQALDYLLKPFDAARLREALARARRQDGGELRERVGALLAALERDRKPLRRMLVRSGGRLSFVRVEEIAWIEAAGNYVRLHVGAQVPLVRETLAALEARLDGDRFVRIHRRAIVNLDAVAEVRATFHGDYEVRLRDGALLPVGRAYRERLLGARG